MEKLPQLFMRHPDIEHIPPLSLPLGVSLHNHSEEQDKEWEELIERAFGEHFSFKDFIVKDSDYQPENVLYLCKDGKYIATAIAMEKDTFPGEGWFRMVGVDPDARGFGAGKLIATAALHSLAARGYKTVVLSTDDQRIPAINMYYNLGFRPIYTHESHKERWEKILPLLHISDE